MCLCVCLWGRTRRPSTERDTTLGRDRRGSDDAERSDGRSHLDCVATLGVVVHSMARDGGKEKREPVVFGHRRGRTRSDLLCTYIQYSHQRMQVITCEWANLNKPIFWQNGQRNASYLQLPRCSGIAKRAAVRPRPSVVVSRYGGLAGEPSGVRQRGGGRSGARGGTRGGAALPQLGTRQRVPSKGDSRWGMSSGEAVVEFYGNVLSRER